MDQDYFETFPGEKNRLMTIIFELNINECELSDIFRVELLPLKSFFITCKPILYCLRGRTVIRGDLGFDFRAGINIRMAYTSFSHEFACNSW